MDDREQTILSFLSYVEKLSDTACYFQGISDSVIKEDCRSEVIISMIKAIDSYNPDCGAALKTWITKNANWAAKEFFRVFFGGRIRERSLSAIAGKETKASLARLRYDSSNLSWGEIEENQLGNRLSNGEYSLEETERNYYPQDSSSQKDFSYLSNDGIEEFVCNMDLIKQIFDLINKGKGRSDKMDIVIAALYDGCTEEEIAEDKRCTQSNVSFIISKVKSDIIKSPLYKEYLKK